MSASRYAHSAQLTRYDAAGRLVRYLAPRILPLRSVAPGGTSTQVKATEVHRLDLVAYRTLHDAEQAWRIADANAAMDPFDLCQWAGTIVQLPGSTL